MQNNQFLVIQLFVCIVRARGRENVSVHVDVLIVYGSDVMGQLQCLSLQYYNIHNFSLSLFLLVLIAVSML